MRMSCGTIWCPCWEPLSCSSHSMGQVYSPSHEESDNMFIIEHPNKYVHISLKKKEHHLLHMQLEPWVLPCVLFGWWFNPGELWGILVGSYCCSSYGAANPFSSLDSFSSSSTGDSALSSMVDWEHSPLYLSGTGRVSQETALSVSCWHPQWCLGLVVVYGISSN